jgi:hypothetical protein
MVPIPTWPGASLDEDTALTDPNERIRRFLQGNHVRLYTRQEFIKRLKRAGFRVETLGVTHFGADVFRRCSIQERADLYVVRK